LSGEDADRWFDAAIVKYAAASALRPTAHHVLNNWGNCLWDQGRRKSGEAADRLFMQAREKYAAALALSKNADDVVQNYINLLIDAKYCATREEALRVIKDESAAHAPSPP
jgi:Tfp pilus assembly protein PilF